MSVQEGSVDGCQHPQKFEIGKICFSLLFHPLKDNTPMKAYWEDYHSWIISYQRQIYIKIYWYIKVVCSISSVNYQYWGGHKTTIKLRDRAVKDKSSTSLFVARRFR